MPDQLDATPPGAVSSPDDPWLDTDDTAALVKLSPWTLIGWRGRGVGPQWRRMGARSVRYRRSDVLAWIEAQERGGEVSA